MAVIRSVKELMRAAVAWRRVAPGYWHTIVAEEECSLTMNDFPAEPMYTVRAFGEAVDIDDAPGTWTIEMPPP